MTPSQLNFATSKRTPSPPSSWNIGMFWSTAAITVPSLGAAV